MNLMVVDASALVAYVRSHDDWSPVANRILEAHFAAGGGIRIPSIAVAELASAVARASGRPELGLQAVTHLTQHRRIVTRAVDHGLASLAAGIAATQLVRGCDALYLAMAQDEGLPLLTFDREQRLRAPKGVQTIPPDGSDSALDGGASRS